VGEDRGSKETDGCPLTVAQLYEEVLFWSCLVDKNGR
jgi:hypothetical protein